MNLKNRIATLALVLFAAAAIAGENKSKTTTDKGASAETVSSKKINWLTFEEMVKLNEKNPKKIFIDFYTSWCGWCKVMDRNTFEDTIVAELMMKDFYCVKFDAERRDSIFFLGKTWNFQPGGRNGFHELAWYFMQGQLSYPTFCVLNSKYELITPLKGYIPVPQFEPVISFLGQDFWKPEMGKNMESYKETYVSPRTTPWVEPQR